MWKYYIILCSIQCWNMTYMKRWWKIFINLNSCIKNSSHWGQIGFVTSTLHTCLAWWASLATIPGELLGVRCLAQGHLSHDLLTLWFDVTAFQSQAQVSYHYATTSLLCVMWILHILPIKDIFYYSINCIIFYIILKFYIILTYRL